MAICPIQFLPLPEIARCRVAAETTKSGDLAIPALFHDAATLRLVLHHATANLIELDRFEQRLEVTYAEALIPLALNDLEEDRANLVLGENLQQQVVGRTVDQD